MKAMIPKQHGAWAMIPKQHGAWAMLLIPFLLGMVKGGPVFWHIPLFLGWLFLYLTVYPVSLALKKKQLQPYQKWIWYYGFPACCFLIISVFHKPQLVWIGVFYCRCFSYIRIMPAEKTNGRLRMILRVFCSFVRAGLRAAGWERESLTAGLGFYSCNPLYFLSGVLFM